MTTHPFITTLALIGALWLLAQVGRLIGMCIELRNLMRGRS